MWPMYTGENLHTFTCWQSRNLGASTSTKPQELSTHVQRSFYLKFVFLIFQFLSIAAWNIHFPLGKKAVSIVVNLPDWQFERYLICGAYAIKLYSTATVNIAACARVQHIENRKGRFLKPANNPEPNSLRMKNFTWISPVTFSVTW